MFARVETALRVTPRPFRSLASRREPGDHLDVRPVELFCEECRARSDARALGWRGYLVDRDDDGEDEVVFYCPRCAAREFGENVRREPGGSPLL